MQSKILEYLEISSEVSDRFPEDVKEFVILIDGSQDIYAESKDSSKKEKLADLIVGWVRQLMEYLMTQNLGLYANQNVKLEQQTLPQMPTQEEQPQEPNPQEPQDEPQEPNEEPEEEPQEEPQEPQDEPQQDSDWEEFVDNLAEKEFQVFEQFGIEDSDQLFRDGVKQKQFVTEMLAYLDITMLNLNLSREARDNIKARLEDTNFHILNNFLSLALFYFYDDKLQYVRRFNSTPLDYLNPSYFEQQEEEQEEVLTIDEQQEIVDGLKILAKMDSSFKDELKIEVAKLKALKKNS